MVGPIHSSPILGTLGRLHRHAAIAHRELMLIGAVVSVTRTLRRHQESKCFQMTSCKRGGTEVYQRLDKDTWLSC